jgi:hypothetical protein
MVDNDVFSVLLHYNMEVFKAAYRVLKYPKLRFFFMFAALQ